MMKKIFTLLLMAIMAIGYSWAAETEIKFGEYDWFKTWGNAYDSPKDVKVSPFYVRFEGASRQSQGSITDCPVVKDKEITVSFDSSGSSSPSTTTSTSDIESKGVILSVELKLKKWGNDSKIIVLKASENGTDFVKKTSVSMDQESVVLSASELNSKKLKIQFHDAKETDNGSKQRVGIQSIKLTYTTGDEPQKTKITLSFGADIDGKTIDMNLGDTKTYTATLSPNVDGATISYESSAADVASVDNTGKVTALKEGTSTITATYAGNDTYEKSSASYTVNVKDARFASMLAFAETKISKFYGEKYTQTATLKNSDGAPDFVDKTIKYSSSNTDIATIDELTGEVTCLMKAGTTEIKAEYAGDANHKAASATYLLTVKEKLPEGAIVFSNDVKSFDEIGSQYDANPSPVKMIASDECHYNWIFTKGGVMKQKNATSLQVKASTELISPNEFDKFDGYTAKITYASRGGFTLASGDKSVKAASGKDQYTQLEESIVVESGNNFTLTNGSNALYISKIEIIPNGYILKGTIVAERAGEVKLTGKNLRVVKQFKSKDGNSNMLVVKDADGEAVDKATVEGEPYHISYSNEGETVVKNQEEYGESNWFIVEVKGDDNTNYENKYLKSVTGMLTNTTNWQMLATGGVYPTIEVNEDAEAEEYVPNAYTPVNFMVSAGSNKVKAEDGKEYFFMNPKRGEYVTVVDAVYKGGKFYVPAKEGSVNHYGFEGAVAIDDTYQVIPTGLEEDKFYSFDAIVLGIDDKAADKVAANDNSEVSTLYKVAPLNLTNKTVTGVDEVVTAKAVVSVTYYNLAGVASAKPFEGVSIVVTRYADGSTKATKELR